MPTINVSKTSTVTPRPPITLDITITGSYKLPTWPTTLSPDVDDNATAKQVLAALDKEYDLSTMRGMIDFLYDTNVLVDMEPSIALTIEDHLTDEDEGY